MKVYLCIVVAVVVINVVIVVVIDHVFVSCCKSLILQWSGVCK